MLSYDAIKTELKARLGNRTDIDARMDRWINYAFFEILLNPRFMFYELDKTATFNTVAATSEYDLTTIAADFWHVLDLVDTTNDKKMRRTHWSYIDKVVPTSGQPARYFHFGAKLHLNPVPDAVYGMLIRYRKRPNDLSSGATFESLGTEWEEMFVSLAAVKGFEALKQPEQASVQRQLFELKAATMSDVPGLEDFDSETGLEIAMTPRL